MRNFSGILTFPPSDSHLPTLTRIENLIGDSFVYQADTLPNGGLRLRFGCAYNSKLSLVNILRAEFPTIGTILIIEATSRKLAGVN